MSVSIGEDLLAQAREPRANLSRAAKRGLIQAVSERHAEVRLRENGTTVGSSSLHVERHGLPLSGHRRS